MNKPSHTPHPGIAERKAGPGQRVRARRYRRHHIRTALTEHDREIGNAIGERAMGAYIGPAMLRTDRFCRERRHSAYRGLSDLAATNLFADVYLRFLDDPKTQTIALRHPVHSLADASLPQLRSFWLARQFADLLGMTYEEYVRAVFLSRARRGQQCPPTPAELHEQAAWRAAASHLGLIELVTVALGD